MITAATLKDLAYFYANTDRATLEQADLVRSDTNWQRFQHNFDIFILKLPDENLQKLADLANAYIRAHPDDIAVDRFVEAMAKAMKAKLAAKRAEGYYGWDDPEQCRVEFLSRKLREHVAKGDPIDVATFAMMLHQRGSRITPLDEVTEPEPDLLSALIGLHSAMACHEGAPEETLALAAAERAIAKATTSSKLPEPPPPIDIPEDIKPKVDEITEKYRFAPMMIAEELIDTDLPMHICANIAVFATIGQAARLAVMSAHAFEKREPRRDWWQVSTLAHFDEATKWFAETIGKEMEKEANADAAHTSPPVGEDTQAGRPQEPLAEVGEG